MLTLRANRSKLRGSYVIGGWHRAKTALLLSGLLVISVTNATCNAAVESEWGLADEIVESIEQPTFADRDFPITDFGASEANGSDNKAAFDKAILACHEAGGGRVVVPAGEWHVRGPIHLKSQVNLHLEAAAKIQFSTNPKDYLPVVLTRFEGNEVKNYSPLVYAIDAENIALTGQGTLDGGAAQGKWWDWKGRWGGEIDHGWEKGQPNQDNDTIVLRQMGEDEIPADERVFGDGHHLRPNFVQFYRSKKVLIEGVTIIRSPMWVIHPVLCESVTVRGVTVRSHGPNNDGCNPEACRNVLIEKCVFDTGDDCIAIKSGRNADGRRLGVPSENIVIRGCTMKDGHGGVVLGSEMSGGVRNVFAEDCDMDSPNLERAIRVKSNSMRGGAVENLYVRNIRVGQVSDAAIRINLQYDKDRGEHYPSVRNIYIDRVTVNKSRYPFYLVGLEQQPIENVVITNCSFQNAKSASVIEHVKQMTLENFSQSPQR